METRDNPGTTTNNELGIDCEIVGNCEKIFTGPAHRAHRTDRDLAPAGYAQKDSIEQNIRYPVLYVLHGYGQDPRDLEAVAVFTNNFMNGAAKLVRDAPAEDHHRLRRRALSRPSGRQAGVHPRHVLHGLGAA